MLLNDQITAGLGRLTPSLWKRMMSAVHWFRRNRHRIAQFARDMEQRSELPGQPLILICTLSDRDYDTGGNISFGGGASGILATNECEWISDPYDGTPPRTCTTGSGDVCDSPCSRYDSAAGRTVPTTVCFYYWQHVDWINESIDASASPGPAQWSTTPAGITWFQTQLETWVTSDSENDLRLTQASRIGGNRNTPPPVTGTENLSELEFEEVGINSTLPVGLPPAINLATIGAIKNSERSAPDSSPGWDHWYSFRHASNCRHGEAPFSGIMPPSLHLTQVVDSDGEVASTTWADFNPIKSQPINWSPLVALHFFPSEFRSTEYILGGETITKPNELNITHPFFCITPIYSGDGCCCNVGTN